MTKVVYNDCYGGFGLSNAAKVRGREISGDPKWAEWEYDLERTDPTLVQVVEELIGVSGNCADLQIREVPEGVKYRIDEYDGLERVITIDEYDWSIAWES